MASTELITMSMQEADRLKTIQLVIDGNLRASTAAQRLNLTKRQVNRLVQRYRQDGAAGLISRQRGQAGHHRLQPELRTVAMTILRQRYADFGPTLACEKLRELHGIEVAKETLRLWMMEAGLWIPRKLRSPTVYQPRNRRHCVGELVQIDGSDHPWFEDRAPACTLLVFIDDATSRLMQLHFTYSESTFSYFEALRTYLERHGKPQAFYSDKAGIFRVNQKQTAGGRGYTQFGRALYELNIESLCANTSQAKGRVERANLTLQDRLVKELRLQGISTIAEANVYAPAFIADYNRRFAKPPRNDFDAHRPLRDDEDLDLIFTWREARKVSHALTLQYDKTLYLLANTPAMRKLIHRYLDVYEYPDGRIEIRANGVVLPYATYDRLPQVEQGAIVDNKRLAHVLQVAQLVQQQRDDRRGRSGTPARTNQGKTPANVPARPGTKRQRQLSADDLAQALHAAMH
ncbi:ISNCY family transposase [Noviherbaspirillum pedocola]|uniref:ISNCY family transposase n=1 Tax=Noviherbaspirillum pedocola TaxID=2801341 RepID=A0A934W3F0_9BURK|nr:ISNCY family transposase [Noviherbaspirillum pedocola]MBK4737366.1 ISNCY family transposase [Noviherbaspirillum pedocola]